MNKKGLSILLGLMLLTVLLISNLAFSDTAISDPVEFQSKMMKSVAGQVKSAADLTVTEDNRAILAALLTLEFQVQQPDNTIDLTLPMYVTRSGDMAAAVFAVSNGYAMVVFQKQPLSTTYCILYDKDPKLVKASLEMISDDVWEVNFQKYTEKLSALVAQISK